MDDELHLLAASTGSPELVACQRCGASAVLAMGVIGTPRWVLRFHAEHDLTCYKPDGLEVAARLGLGPLSTRSVNLCESCAQAVRLIAASLPVHKGYLIEPGRERSAVEFIDGATPGGGGT